MAIYRDRDWWLKGIGAIALTGGLAIGVGDRAFAQSNIVPDATLGAENSIVIPTSC